MSGAARYGLITEQKKDAYRYFADLGDRMEPVTSRAAYVDEVRLRNSSYPTGRTLNT